MALKVGKRMTNDARSEDRLSLWRRWRGNYWLSLTTDAAIIIVVMWSIHAWQTRNLPIDLDPRTFAHESMLRNLESGLADEIFPQGSTGVIYFFAPWCGWCRNSIGNVDDLNAGGANWMGACDRAELPKCGRGSPVRC